MISKILGTGLTRLSGKYHKHRFLGIFGEIEFRVIVISGRTMLDLACFKGQTECVETLLLQGATILVHDHELRRTPLHAAGKQITISSQVKPV